MDGINQKNESIRTISLSGTMRGDIETIGKDISAGSSVLKQTTTSSVSPELLHGFARVLAHVAFLRSITLLAINMKAIWQANFLKSREQAKLV